MMLNRYILILVFFSSCRDSTRRSAVIQPNGNTREYLWKKVSDTSGFMPSDRVQFMNIRDTLWAFHPSGNYYSTDGVSFSPSTLETKLSDRAIPGYLFSNNKLISTIPEATTSSTDSTPFITYKSADLVKWDIKVKSASLAIFYATALVGFKGKIWIFGSKDSLDRYASAWNSNDAIHWTKMADSIPFGPIANQRMIVFKKKLLLLSDYLWESEDGTNWKKVSTTLVPSFKKSTPVQFNELLWIFGPGSDGDGWHKILVSSNARKWDTIDAPWLARSSPAVCILRGKIFIGGGNHRVISGHQSKDSLLNDIWQMEQ